MTYALSGPLQAALHARLSGDPALSQLVGDAIYDAAPTGVLPDLYVVLGEERVRDRSDVTGSAALHVITIAVLTERPGFADAKAVAGAVSDALDQGPLTPSRGTAGNAWFLGGQATREARGKRRRIDLRFQVRVDDEQP